MNTTRPFHDRHHYSSGLRHRLESSTLWTWSLGSHGLSRSDYEEPGDRTCSGVWNRSSWSPQETVEFSEYRLLLSVTVTIISCRRIHDPGLQLTTRLNREELAGEENGDF